MRKKKYKLIASFKDRHPLYVRAYQANEFRKLVNKHLNIHQWMPRENGASVVIVTEEYPYQMETFLLTHGDIECMMNVKAEQYEDEPQWLL